MPRAVSEKRQALLDAQASMPLPAPIVGGLKFEGIAAEVLADTTPERDVEGGLGSGKTTVCLWAELNALAKYPGIWILLTRYSDDSVSTKLRPAFDQLWSLHDIYTQSLSEPHWDDKKKFYEFWNGSRAYAFGLKAVSVVERYEKIRGLPVSRIFVDQAEAVPGDIAIELRARLRPDIIARARGQSFPTQLTFSANPVDFDHWLAKQFPAANNLKRRKYFALGLMDNAHNLPPDMVEGMIQATPPDHPKYQTVILGQRGPNVIGDPIFEDAFDRKTHLATLPIREDAPFFEAYQVGKHNPTWVIAQRAPAGGLRVLGGIIGSGLMLEDFLPLVKQYRSEWFPDVPASRFKACTSPLGETAIQGLPRFTLLTVLKDAGVAATWKPNSNAPDVRLAMIEYVAAQLHRRTPDRQQALAIEASPSRWLLRDLSTGALTQKPFMAFAFEGGYVWSEHFVSVSNKEIRQPVEDDQYANAMHCVEDICLNFCTGIGIADPPPLPVPAFRPLSAWS